MSKREHDSGAGEQPAPLRYGAMPRSFADPMPVDPGACPTCGAFPPCRVPTDAIVEALADAAGLDQNDHTSREEPTP